MRKYQFSETAYFQVPVDKLVPGRPRAFPLFIYFHMNQHLILRFDETQEITAPQIELYRKNGLARFWCPNEFLRAWEEYLGGAAPAKPEEELKAEPKEEVIASDNARSEESAQAIDILTAEELTLEQKSEALKQISKDVIGILAGLGSKSPAGAKEAMKKAREYSEDIVRVAASAHKMKSILKDLNLIKSMETPHSGCVSAFATIFAMGTGLSDASALADLSYAALLHDVGFTGIDPKLFMSPESEWTPEQKQEYSSHVDVGIQILLDKQVPLSEGVRMIIEQHHERFDGTGFPRGVQGYELSELAQILALADLLDDLISGRDDGERKTPAEALQRIRSLQQPGSPNAAFNPELFESIVQLIDAARDSITEEITEKAAEHG